MLSMPYYIIEDLVPSEKGNKNVVVRVHSCSGGIPAGKPALLFPTGRPLKIKKVSPMYGEKYLVELRGIVKKALKSGQMIISGLYNPVSTDNGLFVATGGIKPGRGTFQASPAVPPLFSERHKVLTGKVLESRTQGIFRVYFDKKALLIPGADYTFKFEGARQNLIYLDSIPKSFEEWSLLEKISLTVRKEPSLKNVYLFLLNRKKTLFAPPQILEEKLKGFSVVDTLFFNDELLEKCKQTIEKLSLVQGGFPRKDLAGKLGIDASHILPLLKQMQEDGKLSIHSGYVLNVSVDPEKRLSPMGEAVLKRVREKKDKGVKPSTLREKNSYLILEELARMGLIVLSERSALGKEYAEEIRKEISGIRSNEKDANLNRLTELTGRSRETLHNVLQWDESNP